VNELCSLQEKQAPQQTEQRSSRQHLKSCLLQSLDIIGTPNCVTHSMPRGWQINHLFPLQLHRQERTGSRFPGHTALIPRWDRGLRAPHLPVPEHPTPRLPLTLRRLHCWTGLCWGGSAVCCQPERFPLPDGSVAGRLPEGTGGEK
jgi:hypothetical protein